MNQSGIRVLASGATELWADGVREGHKLDRLGDEALEAERPFHVALPGAQQTLCGADVEHLRDTRSTSPHKKRGSGVPSATRGWGTPSPIPLDPTTVIANSLTAPSTREPPERVALRARHAHQRQPRPSLCKKNAPERDLWIRRTLATSARRR